MKRKFIKLMLVCAVGMALSACGDEGLEEAIEKQDDMTDHTIVENIARNKENDEIVFKRSLYRTIPEGYKEIEWRSYDNTDKKNYYLPGYYDWGMPENLFEDYTMVENEITGMRVL